MIFPFRRYLFLNVVNLSYYGIIIVPRHYKQKNKDILKPHKLWIVPIYLTTVHQSKFGKNKTFTVIQSMKHKEDQQ